MKAYSINPQTKEIKELDIKMQANTIYSFFNSILIDEVTSLKGHVIYTDANAIANGKNPFFIGEQLLVGNALIIGSAGMNEVDAWIKKDELDKLINYQISHFYIDAFQLLKDSDVNLYRFFKIQDVELNIEWVLQVFSIANDTTKDYFLKELQKVVISKDDIGSYMQKMAKLAYEAM